MPPGRRSRPRVQRGLIDRNASADSTRRSGILARGEITPILGSVAGLVDTGTFGFIRSSRGAESVPDHVVIGPSLAASLGTPSQSWTPSQLLHTPGLTIRGSVTRLRLTPWRLDDHPFEVSDPIDPL